MKKKVIAITIGCIVAAGIFALVKIGSGSVNAASQSELLKMLQNNTMIEIEVAEPSYAKPEQGTEPTLDWAILSEKANNTTIRNNWDNLLGIIKTDIGKNGVFYINANGDNENNNTLAVAIHNREFQKWLESDDQMKQLVESVVEQYADVDASLERSDIRQQVYMGINGYFELLPDNTPNYANGNSSLTRAEAMTLVFRADTPVKELQSDGTLTNAVGENPLNIYAQGALANSYLDVQSKSLNNLTYNGTITRAEFIYMIVSRYFADELAIVDIKSQTFNDAKDGGDIAAKQKFDPSYDYYKSYVLTYALQNPDDGLPTELYKALVVAKQLNLIGADTRWDEAITRVEAIELLCNALIKDDSIPTYSFKQGNITGYNVTEPSNTGIEANAGSLTSDIQDVPQDYIQYEEFEPQTLTAKQYTDLLADFNYSKGETVGVGSVEEGTEYTVDAKGTYNGEEYYRIYGNPAESHTTEFYFIIPATAFEVPTQSEQQQSSTQQEYDEWGFPVIQFDADGWPINPGVENGGTDDSTWNRWRNLPWMTPEKLVEEINNRRKIIRETMDAPVTGLESTTVSDHDGIDRENDPNYNGETPIENNHRLNMG